MSKSRFDDNDAVAYWCIFMPAFLLGTNVLCNQLLMSVTNIMTKLTNQNLIPDANFWHERTKRAMLDAVRQKNGLDTIKLKYYNKISLLVTGRDISLFSTECST